MNQPFWRWAVSNDGSERTMYIDGIIASESWYGDEITPAQFKDDLNKGKGNITVWINSAGGDVWAAAQIYNMLMEYPGHVTMKVDAYAASAATMIIMAGSEIQMSPVSSLMIHNPQTIAMGDVRMMERAQNLLAEVKDSIIAAYELKTGIPRAQLAQMMDAETWMSAHKAVELGFADSIMYESDRRPAEYVTNSIAYSLQAVTNSFLTKVCAISEQPPTGTPADVLQKRLSLISH
ncbi:Clp protease ClpP [Eubacteriales bacterium OttesenSCG-928-A19]|nr:Clp protease ClpP [Eubacteriales bacterium OttesenSCG-928-A19]